MKKIILIIFFFTFQLVSCQVLPLSTYENIPQGAYLKDLNNEFQKYIGTWEGTLNNKKYTFIFTKFEQHYSAFSLYYEDELNANLKLRI